MKMIVGLGNPGKEYAQTRHNVGFEVLDELAGRAKAALKKSWRWPVESGEWKAGDRSVLLVKPRTFMNASGPPVAALARKKGIAAADVLVVFDDVDLPVGQLRLRTKGSAGGHNGLKSVIASLGTEEFPRLRVGVGRPNGGGDMIDHVLSRFTPEERTTMKASIARAADAVERVLDGGLEKAMNEFNG
jgi:PTH1 family peptidyl-tRNA hydrolase